MSASAPAKRPLLPTLCPSCKKAVTFAGAVVTAAVIGLAGVLTSVLTGETVSGSFWGIVVTVLYSLAGIILLAFVIGLPFSHHRSKNTPAPGGAKAKRNATVACDGCKKSFVPIQS